MHVQHHEVPWIGFDKRREIEPLGHDCRQITLHFGFKNDPDARGAGGCRGRGVQLDEMEYELLPSRDIVIPTPGARAWRRGARSSSPACTATRRRRPT